MQKEIIFVLNKESFRFPLSSKLLRKIPEDKEDLFDNLIISKNYYVQSKVRNEIFETYLLYWKDGTTPQISEDNIWEYFQLSKEFGLLQEYVLSPQFDHLYLTKYDQILAQNMNFNKSFIEERISLHMDEYLSESGK